MESVENEMQRLLKASLAPGTWVAYRNCVQKFIKFRQDFQLHTFWPSNVIQISRFVAFLSLEGKAPSSINLHISALSYVHKINNWVDPTVSFIISKLKEGCRRLDHRIDSRLPVTPQILVRLIQVLPSVCKSNFESSLFKAAFLLAFFGFLRVGELAVATKRSDCSRIISVSDVYIKTFCMDIRIRYSKTDQRGNAVMLTIERSSNRQLCPVEAMLHYLQIRSSMLGPLFIHFNREPLTTFQFNHVLKQAIRVVGLAPENFSAHSFRIGAATAAAMHGANEEKIKELGRWKSASYKLYIRPQILLPTN